MKRGYVYIWEFTVSPDQDARFRAIYGPAGSWAQLFRRAPGYLGTLLLEDQSHPGRYLTVDRWESTTAHDAFISQFGTQYRELDQQCEGLSSCERHLGAYWELVD